LPFFPYLLPYALSLVTRQYSSTRYLKRTFHRLQVDIPNTYTESLTRELFSIPKVFSSITVQLYRPLAVFTRASSVAQVAWDLVLATARLALSLSFLKSLSFKFSLSTNAFDMTFFLSFVFIRRGYGLHFQEKIFKRRALRQGFEGSCSETEHCTAEMHRCSTQ
jgi:hypothetical protein